MNPFFFLTNMIILYSERLKLLDQKSNESFDLMTQNSIAKHTYPIGKRNLNIEQKRRRNLRQSKTNQTKQLHHVLHSKNYFIGKKNRKHHRHHLRVSTIYPKKKTIIIMMMIMIMMMVIQIVYHQHHHPHQQHQIGHQLHRILILKVARKVMKIFLFQQINFAKLNIDHV